MHLLKEKELVDFGMTPTEAKIYLDVIKFKKIGIGEIIKKTGLHRGTVYNSLNNLIQKGFISFIDENGLRKYQNSGKEIFNQILKQRKKNIDLEKEAIDSFFNEIEKIQGLEKKQNVRVYYGIPAFKTLFLDIFEQCKKNDWEYYFQGMGGEMQDTIGSDFYKYTQKLKNKLKIKCKVILDKKTKVHSYHKVVKGNIKYIDSSRNSPVNIWIYGNVVLLILFQTSPLISIKIEHSETAEAFKSYFEELWKVAK